MSRFITRRVDADTHVVAISDAVYNGACAPRSDVNTQQGALYEALVNELRNYNRRFSSIDFVLSTVTIIHRSETYG